MIRCKAWAKINLSLDITGIRSDGYHNLSTVMQTIDLCDIVSISENDTGEIRLSASGDVTGDFPLDERNTCHKAARLFLAEISSRSGMGVDIHIEKHIPSQAGLGGGSSDAAAVLRLMNKLFLETDYPHNTALSKQREQGYIGAIKPPLKGEVACEASRRGLISEIALKVGADVPFLIDGGCALCEGVGELIQPLPRGINAHVLLVKPDFGISTPAAYRAFDEKKLPFGSSSAEAAKLISNGGDISTALSNDLEKAVDSPIIQNIEQKMLSLGAAASMMTGSGSCVFGLFESREKADKAATCFAEYPFVKVCHTE